MAFVLGMAKSNIDLKGAKPIKLELDLLRLIYTMQKVEEVTHGYLLVMNDKIKQRVEKWKDKYLEHDLDKQRIIVIVPNLSSNKLAELIAEKEANVLGMLEGTAGKTKNKNSVAAKGKALEIVLKDKIESKFPSLIQITDTSSFPLGIQWDYMGTY